MRETNKDDLKKACRSEKDSMMRARILAAYVACVRKKGIGETATDLMQSERWAHSCSNGMTKEALMDSEFFPEAAGPCRPAAERHHQTTQRPDPQLKIESFSSNPYRDVF